jgi:hypothetical protein
MKAADWEGVGRCGKKKKKIKRVLIFEFK